MMHRTLVALVCSMLLTACGTPAPDTEHPAVTIRMTQDAVSPDPVTVRVGETVCWVNQDSVNRWPASNLHPTHEIYPDFDPMQGVKPGDTWCFAFGRPGIWKYHDHLLPGIVGTVNAE